MQRRLTDMNKEGGLIPRSLELFTGTGPKYNKQEHKWRFPGGGVMEFGYLDKDSDVFNYQNASYDDIIIEEAEQFTGWQIQVIRSALRTTRKDLVTLMRMTANPGGRGHSYLKARYIDPAQPHTILTEMLGGIPRTRMYIPFPTSPHLNATYRAELEQLPEPYRSAWLLGDWNAFAGQFFRFIESAHTIDPFPVPEAWTKWMAFDWGRTSPAWFGWFTRAPWGTIYLYRELYFAKKESPDSDRWVGTELNVDEQARRAKELMGEREQVSVCYAGTDMWQRGGQTGVTNADAAMAILGVGFEQAMTDRVQGWQRIQRALVSRPVDREGRTVTEPELQVFRTCRHIMRTLPNLAASDTKPEDIDDGQEDHPADGLRYGLSKMPTITGQMGFETLAGERRVTADIPW